MSILPLPILRWSAAALLATTVAAAASVCLAGPPTPEDRAQAEKLVQQARQRYDADDLSGALRAYQRAWFWLAGPLGSSTEQSTPEWLQEIVPLAVSLNRIDEALRYAMLLPAQAVDDPQTLRRLALLAREGREWSTAAQLQQRWLASTDGPRERFERLLGELEVGRLRYLADDADAASRAFEKVERTLVDPSTPRRIRRQLAVALGGSMATTWEIFGQAYFEAGRLEKAEAAFAQLSPAAQDSASVRYLRAQIALAQRRPLDAYDLLLRRSGPSTPSTAGIASLGAIAFLDDIYAQLNQPGQAIDDLRHLVEKRPSDAIVACGLGMKLCEAGQEKEHGEEGERLLAGVVRRAIASDRIDPLLRSPTDDAANDFDYEITTRAAAALFDRYASAGRIEAFLKLAANMQAMLGTVEVFEDRLRQAFAKHPGFAKALGARLDEPSQGPAVPPAARAELAAAAGLHAVAARAFREAVVGSSDPQEQQDTAMQWWRTMMINDQYPAAAEALQHAIDNRVWPEEDHEPYYHLASALALADKPEEAFDAAQQAADRAPADVDVRERVGWALIQAGRDAEAIKRHTGLVEFFDNETDQRVRDTLRIVRLSLSYLTDEQGAKEQAAEWALQVLDEFPDDAGALNDLAYLWTKQDQHLQRALRMTQRAVELEPDSYAYRDSLAWVEHRLGDHAAALKSVRQAVALQEEAGDPPDGEVLDHLGDILAALGHRSEAADAWRRSADAFDADDEAERAATVRKKATAESPNADPPSSSDAAGL